MPGYKEVCYRVVFYIKMGGNFTLKSRLVMNGHETKHVPKWGTYSSVVSWDSVGVAFWYAELNNLDILSCDISTAYLEASCGEKLWTVSGKEFVGLSGTPIHWFSNRQNTVETSTFGAELIAARISMWKVKALCKKLQCLGIPIYGPTYMICNNASVVKSTSRAESTLYKEISINFLALR